MEIITCFYSTSQGPFLLITPDIGAHHEQLYRRFIEHSRIDTLQPVIKPAHLQTCEINLQVDEGSAGSEAKVHFTDRIRKHSMRPGSNEQLALSRPLRTTLLTQKFIIIDGILQEDIIPTSNIQSRNSDIFVLSRNKQWLSNRILTIHRTRKILKKGRSNIMLLERSKFTQRQRPVSKLSQRVHLFR